MDRVNKPYIALANASHPVSMCDWAKLSSDNTLPVGVTWWYHNQAHAQYTSTVYIAATIHVVTDIHMKTVDSDKVTSFKWLLLLNVSS